MYSIRRTPRLASDEYYQEIGLMVGLELHQQLDTSRKLYCHCRPEIRETDPDGGFLRRLRPTQSELGEIDPAALFEFKKNRQFYYEYYNDTTCLVEADEEPPHDLCEESIDICLTMAKFLDSGTIDEIHSMRKIVIDGSNTTGFQRTAIIARGGSLPFGEKEIGIQTICLEEDAARKIDEDTKKNILTYRLDRLGIPLIEIATAPDISTPEEAQDVALSLGRLLRSTGKVKRGLGTIRQDVNVSIQGGAITEIKGLQQLDMLATVVELEAQRQVRLLEIRDELAKRGISPDTKFSSPVDVSSVFTGTKAKIIKRALKKGESVYALRLPGFAGLVGLELQPERRLGSEMADYARFWSGIGGIFHTDELPAYGITEADISEVRKSVKAKENDAVILVAASSESCKMALDAVMDRARAAVEGVPVETRVPLPSGASKYARPRPGAQRMYPETDVRPVKITQKRLRRIAKNMPETLDAKKNRFMKDYGLSEELASQIVNSLELDTFEHLITNIDIPPTLVAVTLGNTLVSLHRDGVPTANLGDDHFHQVFNAVALKRVSSEAIPTLLSHLANNPHVRLEDAISATGLGVIDEEEIEKILHNIVETKTDYILEQGDRAIGGLMGIAMKQLRGKVDGKTVKAILTKEVKRVLASQES
jgi:glutamyl-tRNA(Gln) amidotransferase subunit E